MNNTSSSAKTFQYNTHSIENYRESWRIFRIMAELVEGYHFLREQKKEVTVLGSARFKEENEHYIKARKFGNLLAEHGMTTITGGGPGIMEAANRGAFEKKGKSIGLNIELPFEQVLNPYVTGFASFNYFFTRKVMLTSPANAFVFFAGGFGTMDEFFEVVDLIEEKFLCRVPVIMVGVDYWQPILDFLKQSCCTVGSLTPEQIDAWHLVDTPEEAYALIQDIEEKPPVCDLSVNNFTGDANVDWKIFQVMAEVVEGFDFLTNMKHNVTILGSKSLGPESRYYADAQKIGEQMSELGYAVVTGGREGIAEGANKGAFERGGKSIGLGIKTRDGQQMHNQYLTNVLDFRYPFTRKLIVTAPSEAFIFFPGGLGTMHQLFEILTLIQTGKMDKRPIILYDRKFWQPLHEVIKKDFIHDVETISEEDDELYQIVDSVEGVTKVLAEMKKA